MILGLIMLMSFGLVDTFFVSLLGTDALAAISFTFPVTFTLISLNIGLGIGASAVIGKLRGQKLYESAKDTATASLLLCVMFVGLLAILGVLLIEPTFILLGADDTLMPLIKEFMWVWYLSGVFLSVPMVGNSVLRASGDMKTPSIIMAVGGGINALLDPVFIFGWGPIPALGIQGAAWATLIAWLCCSIWICYLLGVKRRLMRTKLPSLSELRLHSLSVMRIGLPAAGANMLTPIAGGIMTAVVAAYGPESVAAWGVGNRFESIASIVVLALSMTLPPFISHNVGANCYDRVKTAYRNTLLFIVIWQLALFVVIWFTSPFIALIFAKEQEVSNMIVLFLSILPLGYGLQGIVILTNSSLNAMHLPIDALWLSILRLFVFYVPIAYVGSLLFGIKGLFVGCVIANLLMAIVSLMWFKQSLEKSVKTAAIEANKPCQKALN
ncbi:MATE family efflux transporter [Alteromonas sp. 5E99-2]|uniref:MATE family efflux transporter n=1 Tax=Alteromonas sp. 5E99-2 TaxID=2817683 RepID=UPI001A98BDB2|nr:MATE family efflux transporter [Alteromonas sp. 5E99-2]MBO1256034.1 MATE family efflux transporter [Alteromonas sp. 5E99-2]